METFLNRYRNITVLLLVIFAQLILLAVQVKNDQDVRMIRLWTVTAVTPVARMVEWLRGGSTGFVHDYIVLHDTHEENRRLHAELDHYKLENNFLKNELNTADRAKALAVFQAHTPSKTLAASVIGTGAGSNSKVVFVDRGSASGVQRGMAVVTPDGIVGKVIAAYPTASQVLLITDPDFAAGVISQKNQARGTLKGQGTPMCKVDYVPAEEKVAAGDWFYTSGDDRIFPRGFPVGIVKAVHAAQPFQEIYVEPAGIQRGVEDVLILIEGVHQAIPEEPPANQQVYIAPPVPGGAAPAATPQATGNTEADKLRTHYQDVGNAQGHKFGEGTPGSKPPDFNLKITPGQQPPAPTKGTSAGAQPTPPVNAAPNAQPSGRTSAPVAPPVTGAQPTRPTSPPANTPPSGRTSAPVAPPATGAQPTKPPANTPSGQKPAPGAPPPGAPDDVAQRPHSE
jgi:rod shape-determining protein MreC